MVNVLCAWRDAGLTAIRTALPVLAGDTRFHGEARLPFALPSCSGAFFYYNTGVYANYLDALMAIYNEAQAKGIPYKGVLLDVSHAAAADILRGAQLVADTRCAF
jgi:hypothetical protein